MPQFKKLTPNLVVSSVEKSLAFYRDVLGFSVEATVPPDGPLVFAALQHGPIELFLNAPEPSYAEYPSLAKRPIGGTLTLFIEVDGIRGIHDALEEKAAIVAPLEKKWYGMTEFAITDPDGWVITFAEKTA
jgi:catechol 2,3-dioxygenase-like lactoylglutathione lyase family enzyme